MKVRDEVGKSGMSVDIGIIGLPQSGKTTVFNALTRGKAGIGSPASHLGVVKVPEPRLEKLTAMLHPKRVVPAEVRYIDVGASVKGLVKSEGIGGQLLTQLSNADILLNVTPAFADGSLDLDRDIATMNLELTFSDLAIIERRLDRIGASLKGAKPFERGGLERERERLKRIKANLEKEVPIRELELTADDAKAVANYQFLTAKPLLIVVNIGEEQLPRAEAMEAELSSRYFRPRCNVITFCGELESELSRLDDDTAPAFRAEFGMGESGLDRVIKLSYKLLGLVSFFTIASDEVKAWSVQGGTDALRAAGKIHSDMERGFIRAEVIGYDDLMKCGSLAKARKEGLLRLEGKSYIVQDGDVITFLFNIYI